MAKWKKGDLVIVPSNGVDTRAIVDRDQRTNSVWLRNAEGIELVSSAELLKADPDTSPFPTPKFRDEPTPFVAVVPGVGPDAPTVTNAAGAKQSAVAYRVDLLPPRAILAVAAVLHAGATKYGTDNWRGIPIADHLNHAMTHVFAWLAGDRSDDHLSHAACRLLMAMEAPETEPTPPLTAVAMGRAA